MGSVQGIPLAPDAMIGRGPRMHDAGLSIPAPGTSDRAPSEGERFLIDTNERIGLQVTRAQSILYRLVGESARETEDGTSPGSYRPSIMDRTRMVAARTEFLDQLMARLETII